MTNSVCEPSKCGISHSAVFTDFHSLKISEPTEALDQKKLNSESRNHTEQFAHVPSQASK